MPRARRRDLLNKRIFGYVNWHRGRKLRHRKEILDSVTTDILAQKLDHIAVTGDLVNLGLPEEFARARFWLEQLGSPAHVTAIPGNHDAYIKMHPNHSIGLWRTYMRANAEGAKLVPTGPGGFPFVQRYDDVALIGLSSAIPTAPFIAAGALGDVQRRRLSEALEVLGNHGLFRIVLIHHPPLPGMASWRRGLRDAAKFADILQHHGAELVLHGHNHETMLSELATATGPAVIVGVPSASEMRTDMVPVAGYNEYYIERKKQGWSCEMLMRRLAGPELHWNTERQTLR